ncbi:venom allergen 5-like isoform X1 [Diorhabda carinulata]|uniref:venom allergen 5-like isoform X1 n=1 Tax=Diorhabda carinulata TaxID=1163345 RepID=UPI0025A0209D|nr:venom allergen 5-like isoform X1 [Diorhabda carinulata]
MSVQIVSIFYLLTVISVIAIENEFCRYSCPGQKEVHMNTICMREALRCGGGVTCGSDFKELILTNAERQYILDWHNYLRNRVAMGKERRGGEQPSASNMNTLVYNKELEFMAQCWINECHESILVHDKCRRTKKFSWVGQNLAYVGSTAPNELSNRGSMIKKLILGWYDEVALFNKTWVSDHQERLVNIGHYTAMIWADTKNVGCGMSYYSYKESNKTWYILKLGCNYGPGGNYLGRPLYKIGKPATKCTGRKVNRRFPGLCGVDISVNQTKGYENILFNFRV